MIKSHVRLAIAKLHFSSFPNDLTQDVNKTSAVNTHISLTGMAINAMLVPICDTPSEGAKYAKISDKEESAGPGAEMSLVCLIDIKKATAKRGRKKVVRSRLSKVQISPGHGRTWTFTPVGWNSIEEV